MKTMWIVSGLVVALGSGPADASNIENGAENDAAIAQDDGAPDGLVSGNLRLRYDTNYATVDLNTGWIEVCDMEEDGNGVSALIGYLGGEMWVGDGNGSQGGCGNAYLPPGSTDYPEYVHLYICEDGFFGLDCEGPASSP